MLSTPQCGVPLPETTNGLSPDGVSTELFASSPFSVSSSPHHAVAAVKQLRREVESLQRNLECERECRQRAVQALADTEAMYAKRCEEYMEAIQNLSAQHSRDLAGVVNVHQSAFDAQCLEVTRLEQKCARLEGRVTDLANQLLAVKDKELRAKQAVESLKQELATQKQRETEAAISPESRLMPSAPGMDAVLHAARLVQSSELERLSLEVTFLRQQLAEEKQCREAVQTTASETMSQLRGMRARHDAMKSERELEGAKHVEQMEQLSAAHSKEVAKLKQEMKWVSAEWDQRLEEALTAQKLQFDVKLNETTSKARDRERELQIAARLERDKMQDAVKAARVELLSYKNRCQLFDRIAKLQNLRLLKNLLTIMNQHAVKVKQQNVASAKIASLEKELTAAQTALHQEAEKRNVITQEFEAKLLHDRNGRKVLLDSILTLHRDSGLEYKAQSGSHFRKIAECQQFVKELQVTLSNKSAEIATAQDQVRKLENEQTVLSRQNTVKDGGDIDVALSRRKRRVNDEYEASLERVKRLLEEQAILSARLSAASTELHSQEDAFHDWQGTVLRNLLDGLRAIVQQASEWKLASG